MIKRFIILTILVLSNVYVFAQDVILKKDGSEINAKVIEITEKQVKYKDFDFQSGPIRNVNIVDVFMITYENGRKEIFKTQTPTTSVTQTIIHERSYKKEFDRIGSDDHKMLDFFKKNNFKEYYNRFESACDQRKAGSGLLGSGIGFMVGGTVLVVCGSAGNDMSWLMPVGYVFIGIGEVLTIVSIPISASAGTRKKAIKNDFAREYFGISNYTYQPKLNLGQTANGIGLTLNF